MLGLRPPFRAMLLTTETVTGYVAGLLDAGKLERTAGAGPGAPLSAAEIEGGNLNFAWVVTGPALREGSVFVKVSEGLP